MHHLDECPLTIEDAEGSRVLAIGHAAGPVAWRTLRISVIPRLALVVRPGSRVVFEPCTVRAGESGLIVFGPTGPDWVPNGLGVTIRFRLQDEPGARGQPTELALWHDRVPRFDPREPWVERRFDPGAAAGRSGRFVVECVAAPGAPPEEGELALFELVTSDEGTMDLARARSFRRLRMRNEKATFDAYYRHSIFQDDAGLAARPAQVAATGDAGAPAAVPSPAPAASPASAFSHAHALLVERLALDPPAFGWRLRTKLEALIGSRGTDPRSRLRILSLCSGAARIETDFVRGLDGDRLSVTLLDLNPDLLRLAKESLSAWCAPECIVGDVNELDLQGRRFDVIVCVSGLHHVVEMERVVDEVAAGLDDGGEFWSVGETVGRNGGRLWPESYEVASAFFDRLAPKHRQNRYCGAVDARLPDDDYSIDCFEGIRCEAIEPALLQRLAPIHVSRHNCFVWKLFSPAYSDNYDLGLPKDRRLVEEAVDQDVNLQRRGGRPVELNGVFAKRR